MSVVSVYAVFADEAEAQRIGRLMIEEKLAACVNIFGPMHSIYRWQGTIEEAAEVAALFKTTGDALDRLIVRIAELHSHDTPCVTATPIDKLFAPYADWVERHVD